MKYIIAGTRGFQDYPRLREVVIQVTHRDLPISEVVSGTARGADQLGEQFANEFGIAVAKFPADWDTHGKSAGYIRNSAMADYGDLLVAFWDGKSRGTKHMINLARDKGLKVFVYDYVRNEMVTDNV